MGPFKRRHAEHKGAAPGPTTRRVEATLYTGPVTLEVVGESFHQDTLWSIVGGVTDEYVRHEVIAALVPEFDNPYDANAVAVQIDGQVVGHLPRDLAPLYRGVVLDHMHDTGRAVALTGMICGGGWRGTTRGALGVFLEHDPADFGLAEPSAQYATGSPRTGASEVAAGHGLGWLDALPVADRPAIAQLRAGLERVTDPVERHFVYAALEHRLYHARELYAEALEEFDQACVAHDGEMDTIRPALIASLGGVPLLETYKQACIRAAKAQRWSDVERWAERGLTIYGDNAIREEAVEDLAKRFNHARAKLAPRTKRGHQHEPPAAAPQHPQPVVIGAVVTETLRCSRCGGVFQREVTRGRKPLTCPDCRA